MSRSVVREPEAKRGKKYSEHDHAAEAGRASLRAVLTSGTNAPTSNRPKYVGSVMAGCAAAGDAAAARPAMRRQKRIHQSTAPTPHARTGRFSSAAGRALPPFNER